MSNNNDYFNEDDCTIKKVDHINETLSTISPIIIFDYVNEFYVYI